MNDNNKHQLVIIGAGPGGYRAAYMAADLGLKVTLVDPEVNPGGVCLYRGCIPTKTLLHLAKIIHDAGHAREMGINFSSPEIDIGKMKEGKNQIIKKLTGGLGQLAKARKINYVRGYAKFLDSRTLEINETEGQKKNITFENVIIATGAKPFQLPGIDYKSPRIMTSSESLELKNIPKKLLIVGGGYIGLEMTIIYNMMGSKVSVAEITDNFMPGMDKDLISAYRKASKSIHQDIFLETKVKKAEEEKNGIKMDFENKHNETFSKKYDKILVAIGQQPNTDGLGLENTSIERDEKGFIKISKQQQTSMNSVFAIGDVAGPPLLAHKASYEGKVAAEVIAGYKSTNDAKAIPAVIYTLPEIATCGLSENEAKAKKVNYKIEKFPWSASGRAVAMNENAGFTKLLVDPQNERILGAKIVGKDAGDMIAELVLAIEMAATAEDVARTIHPHPTLSETIMEAAEMFYGHPAHTFPKK
jgi:dihydrolipoamide dehydrogenase